MLRHSVRLLRKLLRRNPKPRPLSDKEKAALASALNKALAKGQYKTVRLDS